MDGTEVPVVSWAVRRYSRYLQQLGRQSPRRLTLPQVRHGYSKYNR